jgi:cellulose synthase/poly-beta-1,6-N-acetylglucosamine synthase-like glycosyltransferase
VKRVLFGSVALVLYTFIGYPAVVAALARLRPRPVRTRPGFEPDVSLVIVAYNEEDVIGEKLANTRSLDYPRERLEVVVVADGSDDRTPELAREVEGTRVLFEPERRGKLAAMNRAFEAARGDVLVFSDANNRYSVNALRALVAPFADPSVGVVTGRKAIDDGQGRPLDRAEGLYWRYESKVKEWESAVGSVTGVAGEALAFRREAYRSPRPGTMNDDFVQAFLAALDGWRVVYAPEAVSLERASATLADEATRRSRLVTGRWQALRELLPLALRRNPRLAWQVVSHKGLRPLVPFAMLGAAVSNVSLARDRRWARALLGLQAGFYAAALAGWETDRRGRRNRWLYLPYYFCRMNAATLDGIRNFVARRHEAVWAKVRRG